jgi:hypothetical protein
VLEALPAVSISSDDDTDSTESDGDNDSELDVDMCIEDDVDAPDGVDIDGDVDMERDCQDGEDEEEEDEREEEGVDEDEEEEEDEDNGKEPRTIGQGEMVNTSADNVDTMVHDEPTVLPWQRQEMREHASRQKPPAPAPRPPTLESPPRPRNPETHTLSGLEFLGLVTTQNPRPTAPTLRQPEAAGNTSGINVEQYLLRELAGGDSLPEGPVPDVALPDVAFPNIPLPNVPLPDDPLLAARADGSVGEE